MSSSEAPIVQSLEAIPPSQNNQQLAKPEPKWIHLSRYLSKTSQNRVFVDPSGVGHFNSMTWEPPCELLDCGTNYLLKFEVPGIDKKSLSLQYSNNWVIVSGNKNMPIDEGDFCFTEILYGQFRREVPVPVDASKDGIKAYYQEGILYVKLLKVSNSNWVNVEIV
ncbi:heat shock protein, Hsp20 family protein [Entamoeba histolytica HM-3:IMSS]|uniref:Heat shock protein, Hsp20 family, putative n=4 Tax=Entamoeba histolytica TaxID=5759 RepID=C4M4U3_ENTH1|nr:heat shock protein, Hsp20 family, putative [Entamoeba histolytica HM-1:IMSS]EAL46559.1 heat shock protein, Hsp20 family, putative [Entamoeba histolytica HM-1:IMSS]EMD45172.1 heat shock protein Hsp20 family protein [Entamoeba histolytica KU27]EMS16138.1 heat shock protein, Hsp20 family protein [Entamoeba histolytica HM-3:IMSS]GAT96400.1 heat shock protein hsp20 family putative [Entamoeba histolytica]|eukprot:XP_651946.1 heat shock protein, Hsp20 family, putative [Entamoeba histolytica HM-1:IMSS]